MILKAKVSLRAKRGNLLGKNVFLFMRLLHSIRNDIIKALLNYLASTTGSLYRYLELNLNNALNFGSFRIDWKAGRIWGK
jgi:hypothetical protein